MARVPDVPERVVAADFFEDEGGLFWHARILLAATPAAGVWIAGTPDNDIESLELKDHRVVPFARGAPYPVRVRNELYAFENPIPDRNLREMREMARDLLGVLGALVPGQVPAGSSPGVCLIADTAHAQFGEELPRDIAARDIVQRGTVALVQIDQVWTTAELVGDTETETWMLGKHAGAGHDPRFISDARLNGARFVTFRDALALYKQRDFKRWPLRGECAAGEFLKSFLGSGYEFLSHHNNWADNSGISPKSAVAKAQHASEALTRMFQFDQVDLTNSASAEWLIRWLITIETATRRSPKNPDFTGLGHFMAAPVTEDGTIQVPIFSHWLSGIQRDEAQVLKQGRLLREERATDERRRGDVRNDYSGNGGYGGSGSGGRDGRGRGRDGRGRDGRGGGRGGDGAPPRWFIAIETAKGLESPDCCACASSLARRGAPRA